MKLEITLKWKQNFNIWSKTLKVLEDNKENTSWHNHGVSEKDS